MKISNVCIKNFRLLKEVSLSFEDTSTVIVGRNNSGKTSLTEIFRRIMVDGKPRFDLYDFNIGCIPSFKKALSLQLKKAELKEIRETLPVIEIRLTIVYDKENPDLGLLSDFIIDLNPDCTEALIIVRQQLGDGQIQKFFEGLEDDSAESLQKLNKYLKDRIPQYYNTVVLAQDPNDETNKIEVDLSKLKRLIGTGFINAQRGLDDITHMEKDVLGKALGKLFKTANNEAAPADLKEKSAALEIVINELQEKVDHDFSEKLDALLPALQIFGYPGLADPNMSTETTLNIGNILDSHTKIRYAQGDGIFLPETYNGLGSRNLIYILFQLFEFFRDWQTSPVSNNLYLVFIEEPEAHLHPQMQQVFIKQISEIAKQFSEKLNGGKDWPVQFIVTTHSTHIANESDFGSIRYFLTERNEQIETRIKDLRVEFRAKEDQKDRDFLHKYLTLTRCDLFFADKAVLIEGPTERILMPVIMHKVDEDLPDKEKLRSQYLTTIEVGGAYAHHFYKFLDFLELRTLIITDIDSVKKDGSSYGASTTIAGTHSSNAGINNWFNKDAKGPMELKSILGKKTDDKVSGFRRIAYQIAEPKMKAGARSFEDAFILANQSFFSITGKKEDEIITNAYNAAIGIGKTNFALKYAIEDTTWNVPFYISEGLKWLAKMPNVKNPKAEKVMTKVVKEILNVKDKK